MVNTYYNLLNNTGTNITIPNLYFREIISSVNPDIIVVQEMTSQASVDGFKNSVLLNNYSITFFR